MNLTKKVIEQRKKINTLENENETLRNTIKDELYKEFEEIYKLFAKDFNLTKKSDNLYTTIKLGDINEKC